MRLAVACMAAVLAAGCDGRATVSGRVTLDGAPLAGSEDVRALVQFYPLGGGGRPATGSLDEEGRYQLAAGSQRRIEPGTYAVTISATRIIQPKESGGTPSGRRITPTRYADAKQSGWQRDVEPGRNTFDFNLESGN